MAQSRVFGPLNASQVCGSGWPAVSLLGLGADGGRNEHQAGAVSELVLPKEALTELIPPGDQANFGI